MSCSIMLWFLGDSSFGVQTCGACELGLLCHVLHGLRFWVSGYTDGGGEVGSAFSCTACHPSANLWCQDRLLNSFAVLPISRERPVDGLTRGRRIRIESGFATIAIRVTAATK